MIRVYVRKPGQNTGRVYKSKTSVLNDKVAILGFISFVAPGLITEAEWRVSQQTIVDKFNLYISETYVNGNTAVARNMPYFNWDEVIKYNWYKTK